jgi:hypothetical protein
MFGGPVDLVFRYFWVLGVVASGANVLAGRRKARVLVETGRITRDELDMFCKTAFLSFGGIFALMGFWQHVGGFPHPLCLVPFPPVTQAGWGWYATYAAAVVLCLWWLWMRNGADLLARIGPAFLNGPVDRVFQPRTTALVVTAVILLALVGGIAAQRWTGDSHFAFQGCGTDSVMTDS